MMHSRLKQLLSRMLRLGAAVVLPTGIAIASFPQTARADRNPFEICARELIETNLSPAEASEACAEALEPKDLSLCVLKIYELTPVDATSALRSCFRARRPLDLATCAIEVTREFQDRATVGAEEENTEVAKSLALSTLDTCRRSLLPRRFAECAIGLSREVDLAATNILTTCIEAEAFPANLFPGRAN
jgi:hypothetical protein